MSKKPLIVSFSGGRTSAFLSYILTHTHKHLVKDYELHFVFANTGCEHEKTLEFIDKCDKAWGLNVVWLEAVVKPTKGAGTRHKIVSFETASRMGEPMIATASKYTTPSPKVRVCTRVTKLDTINSWSRSMFGTTNVATALGIRADEPKRIKQQKYRTLLYPLFDLGITKEDVLDFFSTYEFDLEIPEYLGNCVWCIHKSVPKLQAAYRDAPDYFKVVKVLESIVPDHPMYRGNRKLIDVLNLPTSENLDRFVGECSESCEFISAIDDLDDVLDYEHDPMNFI